MTFRAHDRDARLNQGDALMGRLTQIIRGRGCGFIRAADGQAVFFHASELLDATLNELTVGEAVQFKLVSDSVSGPRATLVRRGKDV